MPTATKPAATSDRTRVGGKFLTFRLGDELYGIEVMKVRHAVPMAKIAEVPHMPAHIKGIVHLGGKLVPVVDLRLRLGLWNSRCPARASIVVVEVQLRFGRTMLMGMVVDALGEIIELSPGVLPQERGLPPRLDGGCLLGEVNLNGSVKTLLNVDHVATGDELAALMIGRRLVLKQTDAGPGESF